MTERYGRLAVAAAVALGAMIASPVARAQRSDPDGAAAAVARYAFQLTPAMPAVSRPIVVDRTPALSVSLTAASPLLHVALIAPGGNRYFVGDRVQGVFTSRVVPVESQSPGRDSMYLATVVEPAPGLWSIEVANPETPEANIDVTVVCTFDNAVRLALSGADSTYASGTPIRLALALSDGTARNRGLSIQARLRLQDDPAVNPTPVIFTDDGHGADESAGDGIYEAFVEPGQIGTFRIDLDAEGVASTGAFRRSAAGLLHVVARTAEITTFTSRGVDLDQDGILDELVVSPVAMILEDDDYLVTVRLRGSNGQEMERSVQTLLTAGIGSVDVVFDAADIVGEIGVDGPYHIAEMAFLHSTGGDVVPADVRDDPGDTDAYAIATLRQPPVRLTGEGTAIGVDTEGGGLFGRLDVTVELLADVAGAYSFSASLTDASGHELGFAAGSDVLQKGSSAITLQIPAEPIGASGIDGPYCLSNLVLFGAGQSLVVGQALRTGRFQASQFEGSADGRTSSSGRTQLHAGVCEPSNRRAFSPVVEALFVSPLRAIGNGQQKP